MAKVELKTKKNDVSVEDFINSVDDDKKKADSKVIMDLMSKATNDKPKMWGSSIIGFGSVVLKYETGREMDWMKIGFSPRKQNITLYVLNGFDRQEELLNQLGKHKIGKGCLYINKLEDIDMDILKELIKESAQHKTSRES